MLKEYLKAHNASIYSISKRSGILYSTLNDIVNCKVEIENVKGGILYSLARRPAVIDTTDVIIPDMTMRLQFEYKRYLGLPV